MSGRKRTVNPRHERVIKKIGLLPLTPMTKIHERFGVPVYRIQLADKRKPAGERTVFELVRRFSENPEKRPLLQHPKLWAVARTLELAPTHTAVEIQKILSQEAEELNRHAHAKRFKVPHLVTIDAQIIKIAPRTADQTRAIRSRLNTVRTPNNLDAETRQRLVSIAYDYLQKRPPTTRAMPREELTDEILRRLEREAIYFQPHPKMRLEEAWRRFLSRRIKFIRIDALRSKGPYTRKNKKRGIREISEYFASEKPGRRAEAQPEIEFDRPLTPTETTVINGFLEGKRQVDIARELQIPTSGVHEILKRIRKIARRKT
ncbi:MAG TPA: hypothetical protein VI977_06655 [archaeon]|nr:hypothetical protein [archaeon]